MSKKNFKAILYVNWKTGVMHVCKRVPKSASAHPWEVGIKLDIDIELPELKQHVVKGSIVIPETQVHDMILESL